MIDIRHHKSLIASAVLVVAGFALYWNTLPAPFVFDDEHAIVINEQIRHLSTSLSPTEPGSPLAGRPLVSLTFAANYALGGLNVRGYHLVNIALHVLCALLLFAVTARTFETAARTSDTAARTFQVHDAPFAIALVWMVHPLVSEAVNYVSQRTELMMAAFFLLTLHAAQRAVPAPVPVRLKPDATGVGQSTGWLVLSVVCCALGMACKETMAVAPLVVWLYDRTFVSGSFGNALKRRGPYYAGLGATWLVLVALLWSAPRGDSAGFTGASVPPWTYLLNQAVMIVRYLRLACWPRGLVLDYGEPLPVTLAGVAPYAAAVVALLAATIVALVRRPAVGFAGAWFFLTLGPTSSIIPISTEVGAERRMYLPLMALVVLAVTGAARTFRVRGTVAALILLIAGFLSINTIQRNAEYLSGLTLWQSVLDRWPPHARAQRNLAAELKLAGRSDEEIVHLRAAAAGIPGIRNLLGLELLSLGRNDEAARELQQYVRDYPRDADALSNLGTALAALGRTGEAAQAFARAVAVDPANALSQRNLALHLFEQNDFDGAVAHAREAARLAPNDPSAHNLLGLALVGQQRIDEAIGEFRASLDLQPAGNDAAGYLERTLKATGR